MLFILRLTWKSIKNRRVSTGLSILSIAISVFLLIGIERVRTASQESFENTVHGVDLIVGARTGPLQLLLYSVFRLGDATNNVRFSSYQSIKEHPEVEWSFPISLGDSHRNFRVVGTNEDYFKFLKYGARGKTLKLEKGHVFRRIQDVVIGSEVARGLGYDLGREIILEHGISEVSFQKHKNLPFEVVGIIAKTGTPIDRSIHVSLEAIEAMHVGWEDGAAPLASELKKWEQMHKLDLSPGQITAVFVSVKSRIGVFQLQRELNEFEAEPLLAVIPGVVFRDLWSTIGVVEKALLLISYLVLLSSLIGMITTIYVTLDERRREMAIFRSLGATPGNILGLFLSESWLLATMGALTGVAMVQLTLFIVGPILSDAFGVDLKFSGLGIYEAKIFMLMMGFGIFGGLIPGWRAMRNSLADGLIVRI